MTLAEHHHALLREQTREMWRQVHWELYHFSVNRQPRKVTIRNMIRFGLSARAAIEMVRDCEQEG